MKIKYILLAVAFALMPLTARAVDYDLGIPAGGFNATSYSVLIGEKVKLYVTINNIGGVDTEATAVFKDGASLIGMKSISAKASGANEEVWVSWLPEVKGNHEISVNVILDGDITDANSGNNYATLSIFVDGDNDGDGIGDSQDPDDDNDGVPDDQDDYPLDPAKSHDTDGDGQDDSEDSDDDNDGIYDWDEASGGTSPTKYDTDGDGYGDKQDAYPTDPNRWIQETAPEPAQEDAGRVLGAEDEITPSADNESASAPTGGSGDVDENGRVLGIEDEATSTEIAEIETNKAFDKTITHEFPGNVNSETAQNMLWWYILWGIAALSAILAILFFILARKRKKEDEEDEE
ncbi:MAG: CARDB domain-containing protein [Patescibacteria group bacterium]